MIFSYNFVLKHAQFYHISSSKNRKTSFPRIRSSGFSQSRRCHFQLLNTAANFLSGNIIIYRTSFSVNSHKILYYKTGRLSAIFSFSILIRIIFYHKFFRIVRIKIYIHIFSIFTVRLYIIYRLTRFKIE